MAAENTSAFSVSKASEAVVNIRHRLATSISVLYKFTLSQNVENIVGCDIDAEYASIYRKIVNDNLGDLDAAKHLVCCEISCGYLLSPIFIPPVPVCRCTGYELPKEIDRVEQFRGPVRILGTLTFHLFYSVNPNPL